MKKTVNHRYKYSISIISHVQIHLIKNLLDDISRYCQSLSIEIILTLNLEEAMPFSADTLPFPVKVIRNDIPKGFAANQNQAFSQANGEFFCVANPDIRLNTEPFSALLACFQNTSVGVVSPLITNEQGVLEDCARRFPTPLKILCKAFGKCRGSDYAVADKVIFPDWVAGMFMMFPREVFTQLKGFDEGFFLYYEDVDLCARLRLLGYEVALCPDAKVVHHAHRSSHRNPKYFRWHLTSMMRYFFSTVFVKIFAAKFKKSISGLFG